MGRRRRVCVFVVAAVLAGCAGDDDRAEGQLVDIGNEPPGENCPAGGSVIHSGTDGDGDGVLDSDEVSASRYVCSAGDPVTLVRLDDEPPGEHCSGGGVAIHTGPDADGDGALDDDEIATTDYVCGPDVASNPEVWEGDLLVSNQIDASHLDGVRVVTGELWIDAPGLATIDLSALEEVEERFVVASLQEFSAPALARVGGNLEIGGYEVEHIDLPVLVDVGGELLIRAPWLEAVELPELESAAERVEVQAGLIVNLELPSLVAIGGTAGFGDGLVVHGSAELVALAVPSLVATPGLSVEENLSLLSIDFTALAAAEIVNIRGNVRLPTCQAIAVAEQSGAGTVNIGGNDDEGVCP